MEPIRKEYIFAFYGLLILILVLLGYFLFKDHKYEYALAGGLIGVLISLILWLLVGRYYSY
jgi:hypothetical protein